MCSTCWLGTVLVFVFLSFVFCFCFDGLNWQTVGGRVQLVESKVSVKVYPGSC